MKFKFIFVLATFLIYAVSVTAQLPTQFASENSFSNQSKTTGSPSFNFLPKNGGRFNILDDSKASNLSNSSALNTLTANCSDADSLLAPQAAVPCNGVSVTSVNFNAAGRTVVSGTDKTVGVVFRYPNVGTAPDGTAVDALVTVVSYNNNQDSTPLTYRDSDIFANGATNVGFDGNLQPSLEPENDRLSSNAVWTGNITYRIQFVVAGTSTPRKLSVAATTVDNDGSNICGGLRESVVYSNTFNQTLLSSSTKQELITNGFRGPQEVNPGIGLGNDFANAALFINVSELNWTYSFQTSGSCTANSASEDRWGSLNMSCQVNFGRTFASTTLSGNVYNDTNGLTDNTVSGTGTNAGGLFANLLDSNGFVFASVAVAANGTYSFPTVVPGSYTIQISTNQGVESNSAPVLALPAGWVNTGEFLGTGTGSDGTVNGLLSVTVAAAAITNANFGIEQRPTAVNGTAVSQTNPGGTVSVTVPAATFSGADTAPGTVSNIRITAFPSNATTITINGTVYGAAAGPGVTVFPAGGVTVPTNAAGNPTQTISVDPINGAVTVVIPYVTVDNAGFSSAAAAASVPFGTVGISGNVLNDVNGLSDSIVNGTGTNAGGLFANLLDSGGSVVASVAIPAGGAYSFNGLNSGSYTVQISTNQGTVGNPAPATLLPTGWVSTGENIGTGAGSDGTVNGLLSVTVGTTSVTNANFGIEQRPTAVNGTATSQTNPGGTTSATVPANTFSGTDPGTNTVANIRITAFPSNATSFTVGTTTYYPNAGAIPGTCPTTICLAFPAAGVTVPTNASGNPTQPISVDPIDGAVTVAILYVAIDQAGVESSATATASVPFGTVTLGGTVFNDINGLTDNTVNGTGTNAGGLFANLLDSGGSVVARAAVAANGTYTFAGLNSGSYTVQISTNQGTVGNPAPATLLPTGWVSTGENIGTGAGNDGTVNGLLPVTVGATSVTNANFGIEQPPTAVSKTNASQQNPGSTISAIVPASMFTGTDSAPGTVSNIRITAFPSNATSFTVGTTTYYPNAGAIPGTCPTTICLAFPAAGVTVPTNASGNPTQPISVDPIDGAVTAAITFVTLDDANLSSSPATVSMPFTLAPSSAAGIVSGSLSFNGNSIRNALVVIIDTESSSREFARTDAGGSFIFRDKPVGKTYIVQPLSSKYQFNTGNKVVNLRDSATEVNFDASAKKYHPKNDFDGDGKSDVAVFRPSDGNWYVFRSSDNQLSSFGFGESTDIPVAGDFDGDGKSDYAVFRPSTGIWYIWQSKTQNLHAEQFGQAGDKLVVADYDGDGKDDIAVYRKGNWYVRQSSDGAFKARGFGADTDTPAAGDFDGDGKADFSVYRASEGIWYSLHSQNDGFSVERFGAATDVPVAADYDGDGTTDIAQFRNGNWYVLNSTTAFEAIQLGDGDDRLIVGDYDGDGRADTTIFRDGLWTIRNSGDGTVERLYFGSPTDVLVK